MHPVKHGSTESLLLDNSSLKVSCDCPLHSSTLLKVLARQREPRDVDTIPDNAGSTTIEVRLGDPPLDYQNVLLSDATVHAVHELTPFSIL